MNGKTLGHYRIGEQLGRGGMGEVYVADDLNLNRKVALKFPPEAFTGDPERMARFEREAKLLASLNHPNIAAIYGLEQAEGKRFIVMELVEGDTLAQRLSKGALPIDEALGICRQIAEGLEAAHEKGVIHRDLKPANVMITEGEQVKILDFGLAKALSDETKGIDASQSPTITEAMTKPGIILGTAAYMSPEQAKGKAVDKRADIWAWGCILYECLTGKRAFEGETVTETLAAVMTREPEWQALPLTIPPNILFVIRRCFEKDMSRRFRDAAAVQIIIDEAGHIMERVAPAKHPWNKLAFAAAAVMFIALAAISFVHFRAKPSASPELLRFTVNLGGVANFVISPNGRHLAYSAKGSDDVNRLWVRGLDSLDARPIPGTESITSGFWSSDSRFITFESAGRLKKVDVSGGLPQILCEVPGHGEIDGGSWNRDDVIVFGTAQGVMRVSAVGGVPSLLTRSNASRQELDHLMPTFLPDGRHFLYFILSHKVENSGLFIGALDLKPEEQGSKRIPIPSSIPVYVSTQNSGLGQLLFVREQTLIAQHFDNKRLELVGEPVSVADQVGSYLILGQTFGLFSASTNGVLVYGESQAATTVNQDLIWMDRQGKKIRSASAPGDYAGFRLSEDEKRIVFCRAAARSQPDIWVLDLTRGISSRLTFGPAWDDLPIWSPDGLRVLFASNRNNGFFDLYIKNATGAGQEEVLIKMGTPMGWATDWSRDGRFILYQIPGAKAGSDLWISPQFGDRKPFPYLQSEFYEQAGAFSPDGHWIAYVSNESGRNEIYVQSFPLSSSKFQISTGGGSEPCWRKDGTELFYVAKDRNVMATPIKFSPNFEPGQPKPLHVPVVNGYAVSNDGQRFLVVNPPEAVPPRPLTVVVNWQAELKK